MLTMNMHCTAVWTWSNSNDLFPRSVSQIQYIVLVLESGHTQPGTQLPISSASARRP
jgi:hypothetical protein